RRHTRSYGDWSSDVCSSDLPLSHVALDGDRPVLPLDQRLGDGQAQPGPRFGARDVALVEALEDVGQGVRGDPRAGIADGDGDMRSEERRVGKGWRGVRGGGG